MSAYTPQQRIAAIWSWLPAFRAVAEFEHVHRAAERLHVTPSALSRSIGLLEQALDMRLFERVGRNLKLNRSGEAFLGAVRDGMRRIDDGVDAISGALFDGELRVACESDQWVGLAAQAASRVFQRHPALKPSVRLFTERQGLAAALRRGDFDAAVVSRAPPDEGILVENVGEVSFGVYCGAKHPLFDQRTPTMFDICKSPFVALNDGADHQEVAHWPERYQRAIAIRLGALQPAIDLCVNEALLAVLPDISVAEPQRRGLLRRLSRASLPSTTLFLVRRPVFITDRVGEYLLMLREVLKGARAASRGHRKGSGRPSRHV